MQRVSTNQNTLRRSVSCLSLKKAVLLTAHASNENIGKASYEVDMYEHFLLDIQAEYGDVLYIQKT